jgi:hypothetical protein
MSTEEVCRLWVKSYADSYNGGSQGDNICTQSAVDCSRLEDLRDAIDGFAKAFQAVDQSALLKEVREKVQRFNARGHIDLRHLVQLYKSVLPTGELASALQALDEAIGRAVLVNATTGVEHQNAMGIAIYLPKVPRDWMGQYQYLAFARESLWDEFAKDYYKKITVPAILADTRRGDLTSLRRWLVQAGPGCRDISADLRNRLTFALLCESAFLPPWAPELLGLLERLPSR